MIQTYDISLVPGDYIGNPHQLARLVGQHDRECEYPVTLDQSVLNH
jgi:hypothetical protein